MNSSEEKVLVYLTSMAGLPNDSYEAPPHLNLKYNGEEQGLKGMSCTPVLIKVSGSFLSVLISVFHYILGPYFQSRSGPLQPKDEVAFHILVEECCQLLNQIGAKVEATICQVQERKQKENLTTPSL